MSVVLEHPAPGRATRAPGPSLRMAQLIPHPASFPQSSHDVRYKAQRDLLNLWRYARAVVWLRPDGGVEIRHNRGTAAKLHVVAVLNREGAIAAELSYHRQKPYGAQSVGPKGGERLSIRRRIPRAELTEEETAQLSPALGALLQEVTDEVLVSGYMVKRPRKHLRVRAMVAHPRRRRGGIEERMRTREFSTGTMWRVATRDVRLLATLLAQCDAAHTGFGRAMDLVARAVRGYLRGYVIEGWLALRLQKFFAVRPNDKWLDPAVAPSFLARLTPHEEDRLLRVLPRVQPSLAHFVEDFPEASAHLRAALATGAPLGALDVRRRNPAKQVRAHEFRTFEVLPSAALLGAADSVQVETVHAARRTKRAAAALYADGRSDGWFPPGADASFDPSTFAD